MDNNKLTQPQLRVLVWLLQHPGQSVTSGWNYGRVDEPRRLLSASALRALELRKLVTSRIGIDNVHWYDLTEGGRRTIKQIVDAQNATNANAKESE